MAQFRKALVAVTGLIGQAIALGVLSGAALHDAQAVLAVLTAVGVYLVPNAPVAKAPENFATISATPAPAPAPAVEPVTAPVVTTGPAAPPVETAP